MSNDPPNGANSHPCHGGRIPGRPSYQNNILIPIIERILPYGAEAWQLVALAYKQESVEEVIRLDNDLCKNSVKKLCNSFNKPTGASGSNKSDRIHHCIKIK
jgi:hypothetical protein